jgi:acyl-coenzyme A thioesterase PaaI-like protein
VTDEETQQLAAQLRYIAEDHPEVPVDAGMAMFAAADAIAGLLADKQHLQAEAETRAAVMDSNSRYARRLAAEVDTLQAEVVSLRERLQQAEAEKDSLRAKVCQYERGLNLDGDEFDLATVRAEVVSLRERLAGERVWLSWLVGVCVDEDWPTVRTAIETRLAAEETTP